MAKGKPPLPEEDITTVKKTRFPPLLPHNTSQEAAGNASVPKVRGAQDWALTWLARILSILHWNQSQRCSRPVPLDPTSSLQSEGEGERGVTQMMAGQQGQGVMPRTSSRGSLLTPTKAPFSQWHCWGIVLRHCTTCGNFPLLCTSLRHIKAICSANWADVGQHSGDWWKWEPGVCGIPKPLRCWQTIGQRPSQEQELSQPRPCVHIPSFHSHSCHLLSSGYVHSFWFVLWWCPGKCWLIPSSKEWYITEQE